MISTVNSPTTYAYVSALTGITQGTDVNHRIGDRIRLTKIEFLFFVQPVVDVPMVTGTRCKVLLYHNKQCNGALPTGAGMFDVDNINSLRLVAKQPQFTVLREYTHVMSVLSSNGTAPVSAGPCTQWKWTIYPKKQIQYINNNTDITALLRDDYGFGFIADDANCCSLACTIKVHFVDQ